MITPDRDVRLRQYARDHSLVRTHELGHGIDGYVWKTDAKTAVKVLNRQVNYLRALACYQRLKQHAIKEIEGFNVPQLEEWDDSLWVVEKSTVERPHILDFGNAYVDSRPDYEESTLAETEATQRELWGEGRWRIVQTILWRLQRLGIYYVDSRAGNISFRDDS